MQDDADPTQYIDTQSQSLYCTTSISKHYNSLYISTLFVVSGGLNHYNWCGLWVEQYLSQEHNITGHSNAKVGQVLQMLGSCVFIALNHNYRATAAQTSR